MLAWMCIHALHVIAFPSGLPPVQSFLGNARRHANRRLPSSHGDVTGGSGVDLILRSQSSASISSAPDSDSQAVVHAAVPSPAIPAARESARIRVIVKGARSYTAAGGWCGMVVRDGVVFIVDFLSSENE